MKKIMLTACSKSKLAVRSKAKYIYKGSVFKASLEYAKFLGIKDVYVLSAKHGLLHLDHEIDPYEKTLNKMRKLERTLWASKVIDQLNRICDIEDTEFTIIAGIRYREFILNSLKFYRIPLDGITQFKQYPKIMELMS